MPTLPAKVAKFAVENGSEVGSLSSLRTARLARLVGDAAIARSAPAVLGAFVLEGRSPADGGADVLGQPGRGHVAGPAVVVQADVPGWRGRGLGRGHCGRCGPEHAVQPADEVGAVVVGAGVDLRHQLVHDRVVRPAEEPVTVLSRDRVERLGGALAVVPAVRGG